MIFALVVLLSTVLGIWKEINHELPAGKRGFFTKKEVIIGGRNGLVAGVIVALVLIMPFDDCSGRITDGDYSNCTEKSFETPIISIAREPSYNSSFVLGTGEGNTTRQYFAYVPHDQGMLLEHFDVSSSFIIEGDYSPHYKRIDYMCLATALKWYTGVDKMKYNRGPTGTFYVPKGTVLQEFKL